MKNVFITAAVLFIALSGVSGQTNSEEIDFFQAIFGSEKKAIVSDFMKLEGESKDSFWSLYDQYEDERKVLGKKRIDLLNKYAENYSSLSDEKMDEIIKSTQTQKKALDKLIDNYYQKVKKTSGSQAAAQFYQLENYFLSVIRLSILESIPVIGEFDL
ncbi:MAG: hypothetical protein KAR19_05695 [Bacteroidales bacterium]|nr:hypothetical protein [Bacteroidales bacterium]